MELQLIRERIRMEQPLGVGQAEALVTGEVTLPGGLREETHVLVAQASATVERAEAAQGRINVRGRTMFHVLYTQGEPAKVHAIEASADFVQPVELAGVQPRNAAHARLQVNRVEARATGGRLSLRAEVGVQAQAASQEPVEAITAIEGADDVQVRTASQTIMRTVASGSADELLREEIALPEGLGITETLFAEAYPVVEAVTGGLGRVGLSGQVLLEAVHASGLPGRPVVVTRHSIPFAQSVEITGEDGERLSGTAVVRDVAVASQDDGEGVSMRAEVLLGLEAHADVEETTDLLQDAYTIRGEDLRLQGETFLCRTGGAVHTAAESGKATLLLPDSAPPVRTVLAAFARPLPDKHEAQGDRTMLTGRLDVTLLYTTDGTEAPVSVRLTEPFSISFPVEVPDDALLSLAVTGAEASPITSDRVELRYILRLQLQGNAVSRIRLLVDGQTTPGGMQTEDIVLCYVQPGETLWDVARRYHTPVESVRALNPGVKGDVMPGQGVVVWNRNAQAQ